MSNIHNHFATLKLASQRSAKEPCTKLHEAQQTTLVTDFLVQGCW